MRYKAILFDLDGTLMPITNQGFEEVYLASLAKTLSPYIDPKVLMESMWAALNVMVQDQSETKNDVVFFENFRKLVGEALFEGLEARFLAYYENEFEVLKDALDDNTKMVKAIKTLKEKGYRLIVATNPMFPPIAVKQRILFSGFDLDDFEFISNYEIHSKTKPHLAYYEEVLALNNLEAKDCLMVGNDMEEDMIVKRLGFDTWLLEDYVIERGDKNYADWRGTREMFYEKIKEL